MTPIKWIAAFLALVFAGRIAAADEGSGLRLVASGPTFVSTPSSFDVAWRDQTILGTVATRSGFLAAWTTPRLLPESAGNELRVTRLRSDGSIIDIVGLVVTSSSPAFAALLPENDGARIYWVERRESIPKLVTLSIGEDGTVSAVDVVVDLVLEETWQPIRAVRTKAGDYIGIGHHLLRVDRSRLDTSIDLPAWGWIASLTATDRGIIATWRNAAGVLTMQRLSTSGEILGPDDGTLVSGNVGAVSADTDGSDVLLVYSTGVETVLARVNPYSDGVTDARTIPVAGINPLTIWNGRSFLVAWTENKDSGLIGVPVSITGPVEFNPQLLVPKAEQALFAAVGGQTLLIADVREVACYKYCRSSSVWASVLPRDASLPAERSMPLSVVAAGQVRPRVDAFGGSFLATWSESGRFDKLFAAQLTFGDSNQSFELSLPESTRESRIAAPNGDRLLALGFSQFGTEPVVLGGGAFDGSGNPIGDPITLPVDRAGTDLTAASSGELLLATWLAGDAALATRIDATGRPLDGSPFELGHASEFELEMATAFDGKAFVVAWSDLEGEFPYTSHLVRLVRVAPSGAILATAVIPHAADEIALACGNGVCLLTWTSTTYSTDAAAQKDVVAVGIRAADLSEVSQVIPVAETELEESMPQAAWNGRSFLVTWTRNEGGYLSHIVQVAALRLRGAEVQISPPVSLGSVVPRAGSSLACRIVGDCVEIHPRLLEDEQHGSTVQLVKVYLRESRQRGVRR